MYNKGTMTPTETPNALGCIILATPVIILGLILIVCLWGPKNSEDPHCEECAALFDKAAGTERALIKLYREGSATQRAAVLAVPNESALALQRKDCFTCQHHTECTLARERYAEALAGWQEFE